MIKIIEIIVCSTQSIIIFPRIILYSVFLLMKPFLYLCFTCFFAFDFGF